MNPKHTTRARRTAAPSTGPAPTTDGAAGAGTPTAPVVPNAGEGITTDTNATTAPPRDSTPSMQTGDTATALRRALVRAILSTLAPDVAATLVALLVQWFRVLLAMTPDDHEAANVATDRMMGDATRLDVEPHARAIVAAIALEAPHGVAANMTAAGDGSMWRMSHSITADALALLSRLDGFTAAQSPAVAAAPAVPDPREAFARAVLEFSAEHHAAALALCGAEVMFPDAASEGAVETVRDVVEGVCEAVGAELRNAYTSPNPRAQVQHMEAGAFVMRDAARVIVAGSHLLDVIAVECDAVARAHTSRGAR